MIARRSVFVRVAEYAEPVELRGLHELNSSSKSASVSPGNPTMKLVRIATPGTVGSNFFEQLQEDVAVRSALHAFQHRALACCSGMSMYFTSESCSRQVSRRRLVTRFGYA